MKKLALMLILGFVLGASTAFAAEEFNFQSAWTIAHHLNKSHLEPWCEAITKASNGKIIVHFNGNNALVKTDAAPTALKNGVLDFAGLQMQVAVSSMPLSQLIALPFLVQNAEEAGILYRKMYAAFPEMREELAKNFKVLTLYGSDRYAFGALHGLIKSPADLKGKRVIVWAAYQMDEVKAWGGLPVLTASSETYMGLQRGLAEVAYVPVPAFESNKISEVAKYVTVIPSRSLPIIIAANHDVWNSLPKDLQDFIAKSGAELGEALGPALVELSERDLAKHVKENGTIVHHLTLEEQQVFKDAAAEANQAYWVDMLKRNGVKNPEEWIAKVEKLAAETFNR